MNSTSIITALVLAACGYAVGYQHGKDVTALDTKRSIETVVVDYPFAGVCSDMLEAAWSVENALPASSPHKP